MRPLVSAFFLAPYQLLLFTAYLATPTYPSSPLSNPICPPFASLCPPFCPHSPHLHQSNAYFFRNYARAILEPLPENALLLINYDMQVRPV